VSKQNIGHRTATSSSTATSSTSIYIRQVSVSVALVVLVLVLVLAYFKVVAADVESLLIKSILSHSQEMSV
jgi:hypothetical protein